MTDSLRRVPTLGGSPLASTRPSTLPGCRLADAAAGMGLLVPPSQADVALTGVELDSRTVQGGDLYAALPGARVHGARFLDQVVRAGAAAVLTDEAGAVLAAGSGLPVLIAPDPRAVLGPVAACVYGNPARELLMLGVTGTNGKTTVTFLLDAALRGQDLNTGMVGTVETRVGADSWPSVRTTPEAPDLHRLLALMVERGVAACSMEVSSHALALHRVDGIVFDVVAFTNLSQDHLDFHPDLDSYFATKADLFTPARARRGVVCVDDPWGRRLARETAIPVVTVASSSEYTGEPPADWTVTDRTVDPAGTSFTLRSRDGQVLRAHAPLPGDFNVTNTAVALLVLMAAGREPEAVVRSLGAASAVPGRMERVPAPGPGPAPLGVVDYAHTPDAVAAALGALREGGRPLVVVLGAGGDRDRDKRPRMGRAAARAAEVVVVTDDNPRSEDPVEIRSAVLRGALAATASREREDWAASGAPVVLDIGDRRAAVLEAVRRAWPAGTVLVAGKGHEQGQEVAGEVTEFDDRLVLSEALRQVAAERTGQLPPAPAGDAVARATPRNGEPPGRRTTPSVPSIPNPEENHS